MALTVSQEPQVITPAYNNQYFTVLSDQYTQPDFKYIVEVGIGSDLYTYEVFPDLNGYLVFDAMADTKDYIDRSYFNPESTSLEIATGKSAAVTVNILEYYSGTTSGHDSYEKDYIVYDACLKDIKFRSYQYDDYIVKLLSVYPLTHDANDILKPDQRVTTDTDVWLHFIGNNIDQIDFTIKNELGVTHDAFSLSISTTLSDFYYLNIGNSFIQSAITPFTPDDGWTVQVDLVHSGSSTVAYTVTYEFTSICSNYDVKTVYFLKRNGNISFKHFEMVSTKKGSKKTTSARLSPKRVMSGVYGSNIYDRESNVLSTETEYSGSLNSGWINQTESDSLDDLWDSPLIWIKENGKYIPIEITDTDYDFKQVDSDTLISYSVNFKYSQTESRQRGI